MSRRPRIVIQSGDSLENRTRVLPLALACAAAGWDPVLLVDDLGAASTFLRHGLGCVAVRQAKARPGYQPDFEVEIEDLCALPIARRRLSGEPFSEADRSKTLQASLKLWDLFDRIGPAAVIVWNGFTGVWANALRVYKGAHGLPGAFMERGPFPDAVFVDRVGVNGGASMADGTLPPREDGPPLAAAFLAERLGRLSAPVRAAREKVVFVPLQVSEDSNVLLHGAALDGMAGVVDVALRLARRLGDDWRVVARPHPEETPDRPLGLPVDPRLAVRSDGDLYDWIERAAVCVTLNSTAGLEAAARGARTVCLGEGIYCRQAFVTQGQDGDLDRIEREVRSRAPSAADAHAFLARLSRENLFRLDEPDGLAAFRLGTLGLGAPPVGSAAKPRIRIERPNRRYRAMLRRLESLKGGVAPIAADFDFEPSETLFLTYRKNREPITRGHLEARAAETLGRPIALAPAHRGLGASGEVLIAHSRRRPDGLSRYELVLDEHGLPHARAYLRGWPRWTQP